MKNRISSMTRWPMDWNQVAERAERDLSFTDAMFELGICDDVLIRIAAKAALMSAKARECIKGGAVNKGANWRPKNPR